MLFNCSVATAKQRNVALFSAHMQIASDDGKFFICFLKSGGTVPQSKKWGYWCYLYSRKLNAYGLSLQTIGLAECHHLAGVG